MGGQGVTSLPRRSDPQQAAAHVPGTCPNNMPMSLPVAAIQYKKAQLGRRTSQELSTVEVYSKSVM